MSKIFWLMSASLLFFAPFFSLEATAEPDNTKKSQPVQLAQASVCHNRRGRWFYLPYHPRADRKGCVRTRDLEGPAVRPDPDRRRDDYDFDEGRAVTGGRVTTGRLTVTSGHGVVTDKCDGRYQGGLCKGAFYTDIRFRQVFRSRPHIIVSIENASHQTGCVGGATDKIVAYPSNITRRGFRLYAYGSPVGGNCGRYSGWSTTVKAGWMAIGR